jgi:hypothetical protein
MNGNPVFSLILILLSSACVDPISFDIGSSTFTITIDGHISDQPGPYTVKINSAYDIESKLSPKTALWAKELTIYDNLGNREVLSNIDKGVYRTSENGIRGTIGRVYTLRVELLDGRIYESVPDTLTEGGHVESMYYDFKEEKTPEGATKYGLNIFFNSTTGSSNNNYFLWKFKGTFKADANPEMAVKGEVPCSIAAQCAGGSICNIKPLCSGICNVGSALSPIFERVGPCECCTCWYDFFNDIPIVSDEEFVKDGHFSPIKAMYVPIDQWILQYKIYAQVSQLSLTRQAFDFWKSVKDQRKAVNSLFQPVSGKIKSNFIQIAGKEASIEGIFFATSVSSKSIFITRENVPNPKLIPVNELPWTNSCLTLFPNSTTTKPSYWD